MFEFYNRQNVGIPKIQPDEWFNGEYVIGPSWFLLSLFTIRIFCSYMYKYAKMFGLLIGIILLLLVFLYTRETNIWNVLNIGSTVLGLPFYLMGFISKDIMIGNINCGGWIVTILLTLISCLAMCNGLVGIHAHLYGDNLFAFFLFWLGRYNHASPLVAIHSYSS